MARRDEPDKSLSSVTKDSLVGLLRVISVLIIFVVDVVVIGFISTSHINRSFSIQAEQYYNYKALASMPATSCKNCTVVVNCKKEDCLSMGSFLRPKNLTHSMSDEERFWRASMVPKNAEFPYSRVPKVAFMFWTRGPLPLLPLWERFFKGHEKLFSIYVHALPGYELNVSDTSPFYRSQSTDP